MLMESSALLSSSQVANRINFGIDIGDYKWVLGILDRDTGNYGGHTFTGDQVKEECYQKIKSVMKRNPGKTFHVCYEAGRCGFTPAREMRSFGCEVTVLPINKLEIIRHGKKAKTDKIDARFLTGVDPLTVKKLPRVHVPEIEEEALRGCQRDIDRLGKDIKRNNNRIIAIIKRWPMDQISVHQSAEEWKKVLGQWKLDGIVGGPLPESEAIRMVLMVEEIELLEKNLAKLRKYLDNWASKREKEAVAKGEETTESKLAKLTGIGDTIARVLSWEIGDFSRFPSGKKLASFLGLAPTPHASCGIFREQGISKQGRTELRRLTIQMAWLWRRHQPESRLSLKWKEKLDQKGRVRKTSIVALARQLIVALHRYVVHGVEIEGATYNH